METRLGYACINMDLSSKGISCNRGMIKRTFDLKGISYASDLVILNLRDLAQIIQWNSENDFYVYRMSSALFPWMSEYKIRKMPRYSEIKQALEYSGKLAMNAGQRLSFHPGQFNVLGSPTERMVSNTIVDLNQHAEIMDLMGLPLTTEYPINIHLGGAYGDKESAMARFCKNFKHLSESAQKRLIVENDDKGSMFSVADLYSGVYEKIGIPITFDYHHHRFCAGGLTEEDAVKLASRSWPKGIRQMAHYSSCRKTFEEPEQKAQAHADYVYEKINDYGLALDIEVESKAKEQAVIKYREDLIKESLLTEYLKFDYAGTCRVKNNERVYQQEY
jgi:UV DNA damage endonuclease